MATHDVKNALYQLVAARDYLERATKDRLTGQADKALYERALATIALLAIELTYPIAPAPRNFVYKWQGKSAWVKGSFAWHTDETFTFEAKVYGPPSEYGFLNGRVSKLHIRNGQRQTVVDFDRGFGTAGPPTSWALQEAFCGVVRELEAIPYPD